MKAVLSTLSSLFFCSLAFAANGEGSAVFDDVAIRVNNQTVSTREVEQLYYDSFSLIQDRLRKGQLAHADLHEAIKIAWTDAIDTATQDKIIDQRAEARKREIMSFYFQRAGQVVGNERALEMFTRLEEDYLRRLRREMIAASGGEDELKKALHRRGQTLQQWEENLEKELFRRDVISIELGPVRVTPKEVKTYYENHPEEFGQAEAWRLRRIRLPKKRFTAPDVAYQAALKIKEKIEQGGDFAEIAAKFSDDEKYAQAGGLLMREGKTDLPSGNFPAEEKLVSTLKDNQITDPIDAGEWYVLIQRLGHRLPSTLRFDEASDKAEGLVYREKLKQAKKEMYEKLKRKSWIEIERKDPPEHLLKDAAEK